MQPFWQRLAADHLEPRPPTMQNPCIAKRMEAPPMPIVFRFDSMDSHERSTLVIDTPEQAARHVTDVLNERRNEGPDLWTLDEDGSEVPTLRGLTEQLRGWGEVKLYDQGSVAGHMVTIEQAFVPA
jgi:hypothetical protein